jgi:hypothetical protein
MQGYREYQSLPKKWTSARLLAGELAIGLVYALLGYLLFAAFEREAKKRGTLEVF